MILIEDPRGMDRAINTTLNPGLRLLLVRRRDQLTGDDIQIGELGPMLIIEAGDTLEAIEAVAGLPIATNLVDGARFPDPDYVPSWEWVQSANGWHEIVYVTSDDGGGVILFVPEREGIDATLLAIIHTFARDVNAWD